MAVLLLALALVLVGLGGSYIRDGKISLQPNKSIAPARAGEQRYLIWNEWTFGINDESFASFQQRVDQARTAGFNAVRFSLYWPVLETSPGVYSWPKFDRRLDYLVSKDFKVSINFQAMALKDQNIVSISDLMHDASGVLFTCNPINGKKQSMIAFSSDTALNKTASVFSDIVSRYNRRYAPGAILFYQTTFSPFGETEYSNLTLLDYSTAARARFQSWLQQRYGTVRAMNSALGTSFDSFSSVNPPATQDGNYGLAWFAFRTDMLKRAIDKMADAARAVDPNVQFGVQFGSVWDRFSAFRGTILFDRLSRKADWVTIDDAPSYPHVFSDDYLRGTLIAKHTANEIDAPGTAGATHDILIQQGKQAFDRGLTAVPLANWSVSDLTTHRTVIDNLTPYLPHPSPAIAPTTTLRVSALTLLRNGPGVAVNQYAAASNGGANIIDAVLVNDTGF